MSDKKKKSNELVQFIKNLFLFGLVLIMWWFLGTTISVILAIPIYLFLRIVINYRGFWKIWLTLNTIVSLIFMIIYFTFHSNITTTSGFLDDKINCGYGISFLNTIGVEVDCWWNASEMRQEIKNGNIYVIGYDDEYLNQEFLRYGKQGQMILGSNAVSDWNAVKSVIFKNDYGDRSQELTRPLILKIENLLFSFWSALFSIVFYTTLFVYYGSKKF